MTNMRMVFASAVLLAAAALAAGCAGGGADEPAGSPTPTPSPSPTAPPDPRFETDIVPILNASCGTANNACHSRVAYGANSTEDCRGWLSLEDAAIGAEFYAGANAGDPTGCADQPLYERLTVTPLANAWECGAPASSGDLVPYVVPGDPDGSYLYRKIAGGPYCGSPSDPMPPTGALPAATIETIRLWIEGGALRAQ